MPARRFTCWLANSVIRSPAIWMHTDMYTENISRSGLLIAWRGAEADLPLPMVGQIITIDVELPADHAFGQKCIHCQGAITRVRSIVPRFTA